MLDLIINLLLICFIVALIWNTDFFPTVDEWISKKVRFYHLPKPFLCALCGCWWLSLLYVIATGQLSILSIALCIFNAYLTKFVTALYGTFENIVMKFLEVINRLIDKV